MTFQGTRILITGGTAGIGLELALQARARGASVLVASRSPQACEAARRRGLDAHVADLSRSDDRMALVDAAGTLDMLFNNAAVQTLMDHRHPVDALAMQRELQTNLEAPLDLIRLTLPVLLTRPRAAILNITSGLALVPKASAPVYCATKAGLRSYTRALRWQLQGTSVRVFEALPPLVDTSMTRDRGTMTKMAPDTCARIILDGMEQGREEILVGRTRWLAWLARVWPARAEAIMRHA